MSAFDQFFKFIVPPSDSKAVQPWRWAIFVCLVLLISNGLAGRGLMAGFGSYAAAQDVQIILELQYAETIRSLHLNICSIRPERNSTLENALEDYQMRYTDLTGRRYPLPSCE